MALSWQAACACYRDGEMASGEIIVSAIIAGVAWRTAMKKAAGIKISGARQRRCGAMARRSGSFDEKAH